jgi:hypothetical protein
MTMDAQLKANWIEALRSGKYQQAKSFLKTDDGYCCLGVLCDIQGADFDAINEEFGSLSLSYNPKEYLGQVPETSASELAQMNDNGKSFSEIADYIEKNL